MASGSGVMVAISLMLVVAGGMFAWLAWGPGVGAAPVRDVRITTQASPAGGLATRVLLTSVTGSVPWRDVRVTLDGVTAGYGITVTAGSVVTTTIDAPWDGVALDGSRVIAPGDDVRVNVTAAPSEPVTMHLVDATTGETLVTVPLALGG